VYGIRTIVEHFYLLRLSPSLPASGCGCGLLHRLKHLDLSLPIQHPVHRPPSPLSRSSSSLPPIPITTLGILPKLTLMAFAALLILALILIPCSLLLAGGGETYDAKGADESDVRLTSSRAHSSAARAWVSVPGIKPRIRSALAARARGISGSDLVLFWAWALALKFWEMETRGGV
jgi:hypothetical protein